MGNRRSSVTQHISLVNTTPSASSEQWVACANCGKDWNPAHLDQSGICLVCRDSEERYRRRLVAALGGEKALEFIADRFVVTAENALAFEAATHFDQQTGNLYLHGECGSGKTHLACMIARRVLDSGADALYVQPGKFLRRVRGKSGDEEQAEIDRLVRMPLLVIDDLGTEKDTEYAVQILYEVINDRIMAYRNGLVVTSNLPLAELARKLGDDRLPSRLAGLCEVIKIGGEDWRLKKHNLTS